MEALSLGCEGVIQFDLTRGFVALVDAERFEMTLNYFFRDGRKLQLRPSSLRWCASESKCRFYACAFCHQGDGTKWGLKLHRLLIEAPADRIVDHVNCDTMDNRTRNLRVCTFSQNNCNRSRRAGSTSLFRGVGRANKAGRFPASIWIRGTQKYLGTFDTQDEAGAAYDRAALEHFGEFARLNFPTETPLPARQ